MFGAKASTAPCDKIASKERSLAEKRLPKLCLTSNVGIVEALVGWGWGWRERENQSLIKIFMLIN